jgi:hypothetical protein
MKETPKSVNRFGTRYTTISLKWLPKTNLYDEAFVEFEFELDRPQRKFVHTALGLLVSETGSPSRRHALHMLSILYSSHSGLGGCVLPEASKRRKTGTIHRRHMYESNAEVVCDAIGLALERGCTDPGHGLAHIAQSYLAYSGWTPPVPGESKSALTAAPTEGSNLDV